MWLSEENSAENGSGDARIVQSLLAQALDHLERKDNGAAERFIQRANQLIVTALEPVTCLAKGGLSSWQSRRLLDHITSHLTECLPLSTVAQLVGLSASHFSRAFRATFGMPFHRYVIEQRIAKARLLMLTSDMQLCEIALECGLSDQAHLTRLFKKAGGETPNAWRRRNRTAQVPLPGRQPDSSPS